MHIDDIPTPTEENTTLEVIVQGKNESLKEYIKHFNEEVVQVQGNDEGMKMCLLERGLQKGSDRAKAIRVEEPRNLNDSLNKAKIDIRYKGKLNIVEVKKSQ
jgi:hypothetical protein